MKKRVLQFIPSFEQGGSERQAVALTRLLKRDETFDVYAATLNSRGPLREEVAALDLSELPEYRLSSFFNPDFILKARACARYLRENRIDIVHTHDFYTNVFGMTAATFAGVPVKVASKRETDGMRTKAQNYVETLAFRRAEAVVANSEAVRKSIGRVVRTEKVHTIYNGIDPTRFELNGDGRQRFISLGLPSTESKRIVTLVANLRHSVKNVPMFLRAARQILDHTGDVHFVVAGEGELEAELRLVATDLGIADHVTFTGRCDDVPALLAASYACVLTSSAEGFSNSILEYMAAGKPVVATDVGGAREAVVDCETGYLVAPDDDAALADKLVLLLRDGDLARLLGNTAGERVRMHFSAEAQLLNTIALYRSLLNTR